MNSNLLKLKFPVEIDELIESYQYIEKDIDQSTQLIEYFEIGGITTTIHNLLTKSNPYNGEGWFWIPDKTISAAYVNNEKWKYRKYFINTGIDGQNNNSSAMIPLSLTSVMILTKLPMECSIRSY